MKIEARFWAKVDRRGPDDCWEWQATRADGYGRLWVRGRLHGAHRVAYELLVGPIPEGMTLDHLCRNRGCVNPRHLEAVPDRVNVLRGESFSAANARLTHCKNGHPFDAANTRRTNGRRDCRACNRAAVARYKARKAAAA